MVDHDPQATKKLIDALREGEKRCRKCQHGHYNHIKSRCLAVIGPEENLRICNCKEFVPSDNLDYIEWLAKKRGLI
jgi:hypothetical protein